MGKIKKFAKKHGKKIGGAALTALKETASTFSPLKKVKAAYKVGKAGVKLAKKAEKALKKQIRELDKTDKLQGNIPSTKVLLGAGGANLAVMAGVTAIDKKSKNKNPKLRGMKKVKKKK
tara:strand:+ start:1503 stop:1859 length:357 start_codon:yes stop_codon:yes gene_type:complete